MQTNIRRIVLRLAGLILCFYSAASVPAEEEAAKSMTLTSSAFVHENALPKEFTCDGADISPPLAWSEVPEGAKSLALIVDDPDAPTPVLPLMTWVHWLLYNIPATVSELPQNISAEGLPKGTLEGKNGWKETGYKGPCPPIGRHHYFFKLYALNTLLPNLNQPDKAALEKAMEGHIIEHAELIGTYKR
ncbi:MAG: YbhB/YbcL family Raf kinase inhibitor-like protein [Gammaproteobacteria bacterium]